MKIPRQFVDIYWRNMASNEMYDVFVCDRRKVKLRTVDNHPVNIIDGIDISIFGKSMGAHIRGWEVDGHPRHTVEGTFSQVISSDPKGPSRKQLQLILEQFSKIEDCKWAETMLLALSEEV